MVVGLGLFFFFQNYFQFCRTFIQNSMGFSLDLYLLHGSFFPLFFSLSMSKNNSVLLLLTWCSRELAEVKVVPDSGLEANVNETGGGGTEDAPSGISTSKSSMFISQSEKSESVLKKKKRKRKARVCVIHVGFVVCSLFSHRK